ncbi:MAG: lysylphosphatidylglycerol synthase transmembrane domain-containing protein [Planctomycetia bacterium]
MCNHLESVNPVLSPTQRPTPRSGWVKWLVVAVTASVGLWLLWGVLRANAAALSDLKGKGPDWRFVCCALACYVIAQVVPMARWCMLARAAGVPIRASEAFAMGVAGEAGNLVMPGANGGDAIKLGLVIRSGLPVAKLIVSSLADRITGLVGLLCIGLGAGLWQWSHASSALRTVTLVVGGLLGVGLVGLALATGQQVLGWALARCPRWPWVISLVGQITATMTAYRTKPGTLLAAVAISMLSQSLSLASLYCSGVAISRATAPSLASTLVGGPLVFISMAVPLPFGAIGVVEEMGEQLFSALGFAGGGLAMLAYRCCHTLAVAVLIACYWIARLLMRTIYRGVSGGGVS